MRVRRVVVGVLSLAIAVTALVAAPTLPVSAADDGTFADPGAPPTLSSTDRDAFFAGGSQTRSGGAEGGRTITVTPDTDLVDGQGVTVDGSGFEPNNIAGILQCAKGMG